MTPLERRILVAIVRARGEGLEPRSLYLTPADLDEIEQHGPVRQLGGLPVKRVSGKGRSRIYCRHGIARSIAPPPRRPRRRRPERPL